MKHGAPELPFEELDKFPLQWINEQSSLLLKQKKESNYDEEIDLFGKEKCFDRWWFILTRIAWCLKEASPDKELYNEYREEFNRQLWGDSEENEKLSFKQWWNKFHKVVEYDEKGKPKLWQLVTGEPTPELEKKYFKKEKENAEYQKERMEEAFDLIKKYFYHLWD